MFLALQTPNETSMRTFFSRKGAYNLEWRATVEFHPHSEAMKIVELEKKNVANQCEHEFHTERSKSSQVPSPAPGTFKRTKGANRNTWF